MVISNGVHHASLRHVNRSGEIAFVETGRLLTVSIEKMGIRGNEKNQTRFSRRRRPVGILATKPSSRLKTFSPRTQVSRTMPRRVRPW